MCRHPEPRPTNVSTIWRDRLTLVARVDPLERPRRRGRPSRCRYRIDDVLTRSRAARAQADADSASAVGASSATSRPRRDGSRHKVESLDRRASVRAVEEVQRRPARWRSSSSSPSSVGDRGGRRDDVVVVVVVVESSSRRGRTGRRCRSARSWPSAGTLHDAHDAEERRDGRRRRGASSVASVGMRTTKRAPPPGRSSTHASPP